jgi:hypothetical protein
MKFVIMFLIAAALLQVSTTTCSIVHSILTFMAVCTGAYRLLRLSDSGASPPRPIMGSYALLMGMITDHKERSNDTILKLPK